MSADRDQFPSRGGANELETAMAERTGVTPNLDFPCSRAHPLIGYDIAACTILFVIGRITGWPAHVIEQAGFNALIGPLSDYSGPRQRPLDR